MENSGRAGYANRYSIMDKGGMKLRMHCGKRAPLKLTMVYGHERKQWEVLTQFIPEGQAPVFLGSESLEEFPSDTLIAQAVLIS